MFNQPMVHDFLTIDLFFLICLIGFKSIKWVVVVVFYTFK